MVAWLPKAPAGCWDRLLAEYCHMEYCMPFVVHGARFSPLCRASSSSGVGVDRKKGSAKTKRIRSLAGIAGVMLEAKYLGFCRRSFNP
jgi:hypothetical protein